MKAGIIGLGCMGLGMARNLAKAGFLTGVYNRTPDKAQRFATEMYVTAYPAAGALAQAVDCLFICVSADHDLLDVLAEVIESIRPGTVVVDMSTVGSHTAQSCAALLAEKQAHFLDAPVSGGVEGARNGTLAMMVGGDPDQVERVRPLLAAMANRIMYMGAVGAGQATKAANQIMCAGIAEAVTEALAFAEAQSLPMDKVIEVIGGGAAGNWFLDKRGHTMTQGSFLPGFKLALHHKDLRICQTMAAESGIDLPVTDLTAANYARLMAQGFGDEDISALYRLKRK